jgi:hypothetical protein
LKAAAVWSTLVGVFLRAKVRKKDGKLHRYWSIVESRRTRGGRVVQRHVLYLGEINDAQREAWCRSIEVLEDGAGTPSTMELFRVLPVRMLDAVG